jgi:predicted kinase
MQACLSTQQRFVVDNTNPTRAERARYMAEARKAKFRVVGYFFEPDPKVSWQRNEGRSKKKNIPPAGLFGTLKRLERPVADEGFDELYRVRAREGRFDIEPM